MSDNVILDEKTKSKLEVAEKFARMRELKGLERKKYLDSMRGKRRCSPKNAATILARDFSGLAVRTLVHHCSSGKPAVATRAAYYLLKLGWGKSAVKYLMTDELTYELEQKNYYKTAQEYSAAQLDSEFDVAMRTMQSMRTAEIEQINE